MKPEDLSVTLVYPAYNESLRIEKAVNEAQKELAKITNSYEIIIAEDGSSDGTDRIAKQLSEAHKEVRHLHNDERLGRGRALNRAFKQAKGAIIVYMDVDLATDIGYLHPLIDSILNGNDISTGSRLLPGSKVKRSRRRRITTWSYNALIRLLFDTAVRDHQCGFKAFNRMRILKILNEVEDTHWFWDTEVLVIAAHHGYKIGEIPINWVEGDETKVDLFSDSLNMGTKALSLWWRLRYSASFVINTNGT
jgi:glycosyltransferase involved in cell wall biosynthesis